MTMPVVEGQQSPTNIEPNKDNQMVTLDSEDLVLSMTFSHESVVVMGLNPPSIHHEGIVIAASKGRWLTAKETRPIIACVKFESRHLTCGGNRSLIASTGQRDARSSEVLQPFCRRPTVIKTNVGRFERRFMGCL